MYVAHLLLHDFRSYDDVDLALEPGAGVFLGRNGQGKTNLVEAIDYLSRLSSHRVASEQPLVRAGCERALIRASVVKDGRTATLEVEINPGRTNRARINKSPLPRARELLGLVRTVVFSPDDLALVKGDPSERRGFLDDLLVLRSPRLAGVRSDYDRILRQRNTLLKSLRGQRPGSSFDSALSTLEVWDGQLVAVGSELVAERLALVDALRPHLGTAYAAVARGAGREDAAADYRLPEALADLGSDRATLAEGMTTELERRRRDELDRGITLVGPHRDDLVLTLGNDDLRLPVKGYASHGESWSFALALRLASYELLREEGDHPILILDDVFAELDEGRRAQLATLVAGAEQVLVTAAVEDDVPEALRGVRYDVAGGRVTRVD